MNSESFIREAQEKLEQNEFQTAVKNFRQGAMEREPDQVQLANLGVAEEQDMLMFRRQLFQLYPNSFVCKVALVEALNFTHHSKQSVELASQFLSERNLSDKDRLVLVYCRLRSSIAASLRDTILDDFSCLWKAGESNLGLSRMRNSIIGLLMSCGDPSFIDTFEHLSALSFLGKEVVEILNIKAAELRLLRSAGWLSK